MTTPSNKMAPLVGNRDRTSDPTQITMPRDNLDARITDAVTASLMDPNGPLAQSCNQMTTGLNAVSNTVEELRKAQLMLSAKSQAVEGLTVKLRTDVDLLQQDKMAPLEMSPATVTEIRNIFTGGKEVPPDKDWTTCPLAGSGTGLVEFRCINGTVQFRGTLKANVSAAGSITTVRRLPSGAERYYPTLATNLPAYAVATGSAYRFGLVRFGTDGTIGLSAPTGGFDTIELDGLSYQVF